MTHTTIPTTTFITHDQFAKRLMAHLDTSTLNVSDDVSERLRFARERALGAQRTALLPTSTTPAWQLQAQTNGSLALGGSNFNFDLFGKWSSILPLAALVVGLFAINHLQSDIRAKELADIDSALLTDDLPPSAYADQGFGQFLKLQSGR
jgi:Protein of unknown function (DUF3619)